MSPSIIVVCGIPATGKSTLASALSKELDLLFLSKDKLEATLVKNNAVVVSQLNGIGYALLEEIALSEVSAGRSVIIDCIAPMKRAKKYWASFEEQTVKYIECICSDKDLHKNRLESRIRNIQGWYELTWADVLNIESNISLAPAQGLYWIQKIHLN